jgi:UDP-N-acetylmuramate dehydrogenase
MDIKTNIPLADYLTMKIGGNADYFATVSSLEELQQALSFADTHELPFFVIGGGSNVIDRDEPYHGLIIHNQIKGFGIIADTSQTTTLKLGAGEIWDDVVKRSVDMNLTGIEAMSAIPGTCGAAPVQNVGAYGQEISDTMLSLEAYDTQTKQLVTLSSEDCEFSYRHSIFRGSAFGRYIITSVTLELFKSPPQPPFYTALQKYLDESGIENYTPQTIRSAVTAIRASKLPDPTIQPNSGSFFKNALIAKWQLDELLAAYPEIPHYKMSDGRYKIPTGWLIEQTGIKGSLLNGMRVNPDNALVLINESATSYRDLANARETIINTVRDKFQIIIEQEPLEIS